MNRAKLKSAGAVAERQTTERAKRAARKVLEAAQAADVAEAEAARALARRERAMVAAVDAGVTMADVGRCAGLSDSRGKQVVQGARARARVAAGAEGGAQ